MKKKNLNFLLALLAALALVFAGACSDGSDDSDGTGGDTYINVTDEHTVTAEQVEALLQSIGDETVATTSGGSYYWLFASGSMSDSAESVTGGNETGTYYVFSVACGGTSGEKSDDLFSALKGLGLGEDGVLSLIGNPCYIDFSEISSADWLGGEAPTSTSDGYLKVTVQCAEWYTLPEELETILIKFTPDSTAGWTT